MSKTHCHLSAQASETTARPRSNQHLFPRTVQYDSHIYWHAYRPTSQFLTRRGLISLFVVK